MIVDDRLQTACDKPGKHHCHCEDEEASPPSPSIRPNGERKRRRSLPCGPSNELASTSSHHHHHHQATLPLPAVRETTTLNDETSRTRRNFPCDKNYAIGITEIYENRAYLSTTASLERSFRKQVSLEDEGNEEKRYKPSSDNNDSKNHSDNRNERFNNNNENNEKSSTTHCPSSSSNQRIENKTKTQRAKDDVEKEEPRFLVSIKESARPKNGPKNAEASTSCFPGDEIFSDPASDGSTKIRDNYLALKNSALCTVHRSHRAARPAVATLVSNDKTVCQEIAKNSSNSNGRELTALMSNLSLPKEEKSVIKERRDCRISEWLEKVPGQFLPPEREKPMISSAPLEQTPPRFDEVPLKNCNLELSRREFNQVLAVLRGRPPAAPTRRRSGPRITRRRDRATTTTTIAEKTSDEETSLCLVHREKRPGANRSSAGCECKTAPGDEISSDDLEQRDGNNSATSSKPADVLLGAILRTSRDRKSPTDISTNGTEPRNTRDATAEPTKRRHYSEQQQFQQDKSLLPNVLNKKLTRFKQLFQKELEKHKIVTNDGQRPADASFQAQGRTKVNGDVDKKSSNIESPDISGQLNTSNESLTETEGNINNSTNRGTTTSSTSNQIGSNNRAHHHHHQEILAPNQTFAKNKPNPPPIEPASLLPPGRPRKNDSPDLCCEEEKGVPSASEQEQFRRSFENAASMVFHSRTGLPLTSSPAPLRRGHCCFDYDSTLNSVSSKRR